MYHEYADGRGCGKYDGGSVLAYVQHPVSGALPPDFPLHSDPAGLRTEVLSFLYVPRHVPFLADFLKETLVPGGFISPPRQFRLLCLVCLSGQMPGYEPGDMEKIGHDSHLC